MDRQNLLPAQGEAFYFGPIFNSAEANWYLARLVEAVPWEQDRLKIYGREIVTARKVAWYGDRPYAYAYSGITRSARPWTADLVALKQAVEEQTGATFNSCLLNYYHHGGEGMGWHSDDEKELAAQAPIASLSFGAGRRFCFQPKQPPQSSIEIVLEPGSLLLMRGETQRHWRHALPKALRVKTPRVNLTFRTMVEQT